MKEQLIQQAKEKGFETSDILADCGVSDEHVYYLWMCELHKWLMDVKGIELWFGECNSPNRYQVEDIVRIRGNYRLGGVDTGSETYPQALESGLYESLKLIEI